MITLKTTWFLTLFSTQKAMLTPSLVLAYWMRGSMAEILYASGLSLSLPAAIVRLGGGAVNGLLSA